MARFDRVRRKFISDLEAESARMQATLKNIESTGRSGTPTDRKFATFVNNNREAQAIVEKVNQEYPHGWLAQEFHRG